MHRFAANHPATRRASLITILVVLGACSKAPPAPQLPSSQQQDRERSAPTSFTEAAQAAVAASLPLTDQQDFDDARRGLVGRDDELRVVAGDGKPVWDVSAYAFENGAAPSSVNPSLWRQAQLNREHGLFQVAEGIYQVRGYDLSNLSLIRGRSGWIVVDPLTAEETARAALTLARKYLGDLHVVAVILTHSHVDHFGGIDAVLPADAEARKGIEIVAPKNFMEEATSENVLAGIAMGRRATYMYGSRLPRSARGHVDSGLGKAPAIGALGIAAPTTVVDHTPQEITIDGVRFIFQYVPESEAPAELTFYLPDVSAFCGAEIVSHTMHNLYTLRGAKVRDALKWSGYIDEAIDLFGAQEVVFASHHWPVWGNARVLDYLRKQRDTYKYIHDQTLRLANAGHTPQEIAEELRLPQALDKSFANRGYYGTVRHNSKAVYQAYFGWFDGNPANLDPLPPAAVADKYVEAMGGASEVLARGRKAFDSGDYRWAATLLNHLVFSLPDNTEARALLAHTYEQLGYQAESGPWRDFYLTGADELRHGPGESTLRLTAAAALLRRMPLERFFDSLAVRIDGPKADGKNLTLNFIFTDVGESYVLTLANAVLHHKRREADPNADVTVRITKELLIRLATKQAGLKETIFSNELDVDGSRMVLLSFFSLIEEPNPKFAIVTP